MTTMLKSLTLKFSQKKVSLSDVAAPKPSRAATRVIDGAMKRAYQDQQKTIRRAESLRGL